METNYKITIPEPCKENWDKMAPNESGRFCTSCAKTVVDFTTMLPEEIQHFFIQNQNKSLCGRFKNEQLENLIIQIPIRVLYTQTHYHKMFLLALFVAMGTTLFSCSDKDGNKQKIDKVEVVEDTSVVEHITVGEAAPAKGSLHRVPPPPPPPKVDHIKFVKPVIAVKSAKALNSKKNSCEKTTPKTETNSTTYYETGVLVYTPDNTQHLAEYPGGQNKLYTVFKRNFTIPENASEPEGELELAFNINELGKMDNVKILKDLGEGMAEEGIRVLGTLSRWMPATINGKRISTTFTIKIIFDRNTDLNGVKTKEFKSQIVSVKLTPELE